MLRLGSVVLNVADVLRATSFWSAALGYELVDPPRADWAVLGPPEGGVHLALDRSDQPPPEVPHTHLDLYADGVDGQEREVERLLSLGAVRVDWPHYPPDPDFVVLADPDGNRFCVIALG